MHFKNEPQGVRRWRVPQITTESKQALCPYACTAVVILRESELGEVLGLTNEL